MNADQFKASLRSEGKTITQWAKEHGYNRHAVYLVLNGQAKGLYGRAHEIAVAAGLKAPAASF